MYLVPLAKLNTKYVVVCERCQHANEFAAEGLPRALAVAKALPPNELSLQIWNQIDHLFELKMADGDCVKKCMAEASPEEGLIGSIMVRCVLPALDGKYRDDHLAYVADQYLAFCRSDTARNA